MRVVLLLLVMLLPYQAAWSAAAAYCSHENETRRHFGHHEHRHEKATPAKEASPLACDHDCGTCQAGHVSVVEAIVAMLASDARDVRATAPPSPIPTAPARAPDRPQWTRPA